MVTLSKGKGDDGYCEDKNTTRRSVTVYPVVGEDDFQSSLGILDAYSTSKSIRTFFQSQGTSFGLENAPT